MKIAVIGSGISGLSAAYLLAQHHDVTLFEKNDYIGGHTRTVIARPAPGVEIPVDTGFIVFNYRNYPLLAQLFDELDVPVHKSDMSFGLTADNGWFEYGTPKPWNVFAQKRNLLRPNCWRMMRDILRFFREAPEYMEGGSKYRPGHTGYTLGECLDEMRLGDWFRQYFILPMGAAIWSCPTATMLDFPADSFLRFFHNHGLLSVNGQPQWYTVTGGARQYIDRLLARYEKTFSGRIVRHGATRVERNDEGVFITADSGARYAADKVVFACHADQALALIDNPTETEREVLSAFRFEKNRTYLHGDVSFMPKRRAAWSSWTYLLETRAADKPAPSHADSADITMSYWMNRLQSLDQRYPLIETLNPTNAPDPALVYDSFEFEHPIFDQAAVSAQGRIPDIQGSRNTWYCGAWQRNGFHEDGLWSAVRVACALDAEPGWEGLETANVR
ncbi:unnamed protein product [Discosporangium mesarthrocarpum]